MGDEEQAIDFADGTALTQGAGELDEKLNDFGFHGIKPGKRVICYFGTTIIHGFNSITLAARRENTDPAQHFNNN